MRVMVGGISIGDGAPISVQSMTNTDTRDIGRTTEQILDLEKAGCDIVRLSVYDEDCARAFSELKERTHIPLVADVHFDYRLALYAAENGADKLRINPGNIGGEKNVRLLADCAKSHGIPIRIGVNSGSLEPELMKKYGAATPEAMLESALCHARLLEDAGFYDIVLSMKASNVRDTVKVYDLARKRTDYPLHIGITEAGVGEDALIKSAVGLGALLIAGIGDTMRVSITGNPVQEVYAAKGILRSLGLLNEGVELISCPTCGRCRVDLITIAQSIRDRLPKDGPPLTVAVMGCAVNGPGEAKAADIGIAFGEGNGVLFKRGLKVASGTVDEMIELLLSEAKLMRETV